jgi:hypothetical protein
MGVVGLTLPAGPDFPYPNPFAGVYGSSSANIGVLGTSNIRVGVAGYCTAGIGVYGEVHATGPNNYAGYFQGNLFVSGQIFAGTKDAIVPFSDGSHRLMHCMESPEHWFEDFGGARLKGGTAIVKLDTDFARTIKTGDYRVFLTPEGDSCGLYVKSKRGDAFEVRELQGGTSNVAFSYRIVGRRQDIKRHRRFARIDVTSPLPVTKPPIGGDAEAPRQTFTRELRAVLKKHPAALAAKPARAAKARSRRTSKART